jgi:hypothetical protein
MFVFFIELVVLFSESRITKVVKKLVNMEEDKVIILFHTLSTDHHITTTTTTIIILNFLQLDQWDLFP